MTTHNTLKTNQINLKEVFVFYIVAVFISAPFRLNIFQIDRMLPLQYGLNIFYHILRGIGPAAGYFTVYHIMKSRVDKPLTLSGSNWLYSIISVLVIPMGMAIAGVSNQNDLNRHYFGFISGVMLIFYALGEEYGWRGYLQQALSPIKEPYRILIIAIMWYVWHLNFLNPDVTLKSHIIHFLALLLGSWGLMKISESTYSVLFVAAVHLSFNLLSDVAGDFMPKVMILISAIGIWTILLISLNRRKSVNGSE